MDVRVLVAVTAGLRIGIVVLALQNSQRRENPPPLRSSDPDVCALILACKGYNDTGPRNLYTHVKSRAIPNKRLVRAFNIDNSFTTFDNQRRKDFNSEASNAIKMTEDKVSMTWQMSIFSSHGPRCAFQGTETFHFHLMPSMNMCPKCR